MSWGRLARESIAVAVVALLIALWVVRVWELDPMVPVLYEWDALFHLAYIENLREGGWLFWNDRLAAPFGQDVRDFPLGGENVHWLALKLLGLVMPNAAATATAYLVLTYALVAGSMYVVARILGLRAGAATAVALLFAFLPFHQLRWTMHLLRSGYYTVPLAALAILWMLDWQRELREQSAAAPARWRMARVALVLASAVLLGASDTQNAFYAVVILLPLMLLVAWRDRDLRPLLLALVFSVAAGGSLLANNLPYLVARAERGPNPEVLARSPGDQELFGLRLARLMLPVENHRVGLFANVTAAASRLMPATPGENGQALGAVATAGFAIGLAAVAATVLGRRLLADSPVPLARLGLLMLSAVLWASVGGLSSLLTIAGLTSYRTWNRMSLWIAVFALLAAGSVLQQLLDRIGSRVVAALVVAGVVGLGLLDQIPARIRSFDPAPLAREWHDDAAFFRQMETALPPRAMVYQFPALPFPESGDRFALAPYEHLKPYLHTTALRFSYGGMKGRREGTWWQALEPLEPAAATALLALAGFDAALVERRGYADDAAALETAMASVGAVPIVIDSIAKRASWDLRPVRDRLDGAVGAQSEVARALFGSVPPQFDDSFYDDEPAGGHQWRWSKSSTAEIRIGDGDGPRRVVVAAALDHIDPAASTVTVSAGEQTYTVPISNGPGAFGAVVDVPAEGATLRLRSDGQPRPSPPDPRKLGIVVDHLVVIDQALLQRLCAAGVPVNAPCSLAASAPPLH
jgi:phosphoglycerol transferase